MKLKKIVSLLVSATMAFSAFAAVANAETKGTATVSVVGQFDEYAEAFGTTLAANEGLFLIGVNMAGLGTWNLTKATVPITAYNGTMITGFELMLAGDATFIALDSENSALPVSGGNLATGGLNFDYLTTVPGNCYPTSTTKVDDLAIEGAILAYVKAPLGTQLTVSSARYQTSVATASKFSAASQAWYDFDVTVDALGEAAGGDEGGEDDTALTFAIAEGTIYENGTVWACTIANAVDGLAKLEATFTAANGDTKNVITSRLGAWGGEGATEFNIGINTSKAGVVANAINATITDGAGATATAEAAAN